ncbi:hypothetical protein GCM10008967_14320 [Bacillus carboniphilus]|uniref:MobA-like NTP transferase domain-containing protein n=1 Tax=Bacillus carboniphilus TaxID=86663 RepID=A0ABN0W4P5_9BACI
MLTGVILCRDYEEQFDSQSTNSLELLPIVTSHIKEMQSICKEVILVTNQPRLFLPAIPRDIRIITDYYKHNGPLCGMHAAISLAKNQYIWIVSAASSTISAKAASVMLPLLKGENEMAVLPWENNKPYFYHSLYNKEILPIIKKLVTTHKIQPIHLLDSISWLRADIDYLNKMNVDISFIKDTLHAY